MTTDLWTSPEVLQQLRNAQLEESERREKEEIVKRTFLVLASRLGKVYIYRYSKSRSLWIFGPKNPFRRYLIYLTTNQYFELFVILTILVNCVILALSEAPEEAEFVFTAIYTSEMIFKIIGRGFILDELTYLRDPWNWLDFSVVVLGYITLKPGVLDTNLSGIRTFRVLRALRTISAIEGLKTLVNSLLRSMKMLADVLILTLFFICIFALIGLQLFGGKLRSRCVRTNMTDMREGELPSNNSWPRNYVCGNNSGAMTCPKNYSCWENIGENPNYGYTSYDHFGWALLTTFQLMTLDFWENAYFHILSAAGPWCVVYFIFVIFFGAFLVFNLMLAVVALSYQQEHIGGDTHGNKYQAISRIVKSYSLHRRFTPKVVYDGPLMIMVTGLPKVKSTTSVMIISKQDLENAVIPVELDTQANYVENINGDLKDGDTSNEREEVVLPVSPEIMCNGDMDDFSAIEPSDRVVNTGVDVSKQRTNLPTHNETNSSTCSRGICAARAALYTFVKSAHFDSVIVIFIIFNTICLAMEYHGSSAHYKMALNICNHVFNAIFLLELILKLIALGCRGYIRSRWNIFDGTIVTIGIIDFCVEMLSTSDNKGFSIIRSLRLFRVLRIANSWPTMRTVLSSMGRSVKALANLTLILGIILYMFAVVGTQVFAEYYIATNFPKKEVPDWNFTNFANSFLVIFRVLCGEWIELLYDCMHVAGHAWAPIFFIAVLIFGNFLILNLFLALLLGSFAEQSSEEEESKGTKGTKMKSKWSRLANQLKLNYLASAFGKVGKVRKNNLESARYTNGNSVSFSEDKSKPVDNASPSALPTGIYTSVRSGRHIPFIPNFISRCTWTQVRDRANKIITNKWFDYGILLIIIASSVTLTFEDVHLEKKKGLKQALTVLDIVFCVVFSIEFILKVLAMGITRYLKNGWNVLDLVVLIASIVSELSSGSQMKIVRSIRTVRALRPLRAIQRWNGIKIIVNSLVKAIPGIANVLLVCLMFWLLFSILGVQLFGGKFYKCIRNGSRADPAQIPNKTACLDLADEGYDWKNSAVNFDNALNGFLALLQVATFGGWIEIMRDAVDAKGVDMQPQTQANGVAYIYFVIFVIVGSFVILNLFISVMIENVYAIKKHQSDYGSLDIILSAKQKQWLSIVSKSVLRKPTKIIRRPANYYHGKLFDIVSSSPFEIFITSLICLNFVLMTLEHYDQPDAYCQMLLTSDIIFTAMFCIEIIFKIVAYRQYFHIHTWNVIDLIVITLSVAEVILRYYGQAIHAVLKVFRITRVLRIGKSLRYIKRSKGIRRLVRVLNNSLASVFHMGILLFLLIFIYSIVGMTNFGEVTQNPRTPINKIVNFETFGSSMLLLIRVSTSAGWNYVLGELMICEQSSGGDEKHCAVVWISVVYFVTYTLLSFLVVLNMHIAIILENFNDAYKEEESGVTDEDLEKFYAVWQRYDPLATQFLSFDKVPGLVGDLGPPLGIPVPNRIAVYNLDLPLDTDYKVHCIYLLQTLVKYFYNSGKEEEDDDPSEVKDIIETKRQASFPILQKTTNRTSSAVLLTEQRSVSTIQRHYRKYRRKKQSVSIIQRHYRKYREKNSRLSSKKYLYSCANVSERERLHPEDECLHTGELDEERTLCSSSDIDNEEAAVDVDTSQHCVKGSYIYDVP